jgi:hypothetical protein
MLPSTIMDPITEAASQIERAVELLQRAAASARGQEQSELRLAEALARTVSDTLAGLVRSRAA